MFVGSPWTKEDLFHKEDPVVFNACFRVFFFLMVGALELGSSSPFIQKAEKGDQEGRARGKSAPEGRQKRKN